MIESGAPLDALNARGETPLAVAIRGLEEQSEWTPNNYTVHIAAALIDAGASLESMKMTLAAFCLGRTKEVARLATEASVKDLQIGLAAAAYNRKREAIPMLIKLGADPNAFNRGLHPHATALHNSVCSGSLETVKTLVEAGARVEGRDTAYRATPLDWAEYFAREKRDPAKRDAAIAAYLRDKAAGGQLHQKDPRSRGIRDPGPS